MNADLKDIIQAAKNKDTPPNPANLIKVPITKTIPDVSWYRNEKWLPGQYKRFRHSHTMVQDVTGFEFFNDLNDLNELDREDRLDPDYWS